MFRCEECKLNFSKYSIFNAHVNQKHDEPLIHHGKPNTRYRHCVKCNKDIHYIVFSEHDIRCITDTAGLRLCPHCEIYIRRKGYKAHVEKCEINENVLNSYIKENTDKDNKTMIEQPVEDDKRVEELEEKMDTVKDELLHIKEEVLETQKNDTLSYNELTTRIGHLETRVKELDIYFKEKLQTQAQAEDRLKFTFIDRFIANEDRMSRIEKRQKAVEDSVWSLTLDIRVFRETQANMKNSVEQVEFALKNSRSIFDEVAVKIDEHKKTIEDYKVEVHNKLKKWAKQQKITLGEEDEVEESENEEEEENEESEEEEEDGVEEEEKENEEEESETESVEDVEDEYREESPKIQTKGELNQMEIDGLYTEIHRLKEEHRGMIEELQTDLSDTKEEYSELLEGIVERLNSLIKNYKTLSISLRR